MNTCISLIGMPGAGKSTAGILLAKTLAKDFVDTDLLIQQHLGCTLQEYLDQNDYLALRNVEEQILLTHDFNNAVIATGGSAVYSAKAMARLKTLGPRVYLKARFESINSRVTNKASRGIAAAPGTSLHDLYLERVPLYEKSSEIKVVVDDQSLEETVETLVKHLAPFI